MTGYIYHLVCSKTRTPFYVGSTIKSLKERLAAHIYSINKNNYKDFVYEYIREMGIQPDIMMIQCVSVESPLELRKIESKWISSYAQMGIFLANKNRYNNYKIEISPNLSKISELDKKIIITLSWGKSLEYAAKEFNITVKHLSYRISKLNLLMNTKNAAHLAAEFLRNKIIE